MNNYDNEIKIIVNSIEEITKCMFQINKNMKELEKRIQIIENKIENKIVNKIVNNDIEIIENNNELKDFDDLNDLKFA
jgi:hypothetical protein